MTTSRRDLIKALGVGAAALAADRPALSFAQTAAAPAIPAPPPADMTGVGTADRDLRIINIEWLEADAKAVLAPARFAFLGPAGAGVTYRENLRAFNDFPILPRRLRGVNDAAIDLRTTLMGHALPMPIITCPIGVNGMFHTQAEVATAAGTGMAGSLYVMSGAAHKTMEDVARATSGPKWFQIYMNRDMDINRWLVQRARAAGYSAIVLTADAIGAGQSDDYIRFGSPRVPGLQIGNHDPAQGGRGTFSDFKRDLSFDDIGFLRQASGLPVVVKGIVHPEDIRQSLAAGASCIWISNHGGRQLDGMPAAITMLRGAVDTVQGRVPIVFDSGIRRGIDVFKALAMGANVVAMGRPLMWGLACGGASGVKSVYAHVTAELKATMLLSGVGKVTDLKRTHLAMKS